MKAQLGAFGTFADDHVIAFGFGEQLWNIFRAMLAVTIHQNQRSALRSSDTGLYGGPVADVIGMSHNVGAGVKCYLSAAIHRSIVDDKDFTLSDFQRLDFV
jgi:hypothetical protein